MRLEFEGAPAPAGRYTIALAKEDFKFSCAHFTLFGDEDAELLHGHNYQVKVEVGGDGLDELGILVDFERVKRAIRGLCAELDSRMLVPAKSPHLAVSEVAGAVEVAYGARVYRFPAEDVLLLPLVNTTVELLARLFWRRLAAELGRVRGIDVLRVEVGETAGQACAFAARLDG